MLANREDARLLHELADILSDFPADATCVSRALEQLCRAASFDCGAVYELQSQNRLCLMEYYVQKSARLEESFSMETLPLERRTYWASVGSIYLTLEKAETIEERQLLALHEASALLFVPVVDQQARLYGFIVLMDTMEEQVREQALLQSLNASLALLLRTISGRMYCKQIERSGQSMEGMLDNTGIDIYVNDLHTHDILYINASMAAPYGGKAMFEGKKCWQVLFPRQSGPCEFCPKTKILDEEGEPARVYSWDYQRAFDGAWFRVFSSAFYWEDGRLAHIVSSADITDNKRNEAIIENMANFDQLTKLPNRRMLLRECERRINQTTESDRGYILFFDIDGFKAINDTLGHDAGDEFLVLLGEFFTEIPLLKDAVYRNGGDEFVALIGGATVTRDHIRSLASFIHTRFRKPWELKRGDVYCNTSIGVACYPEDGGSVELLLQKADKAMYQVKKQGGAGLCFFQELP